MFLNNKKKKISRSERLMIKIIYKDYLEFYIIYD